MLGEPLSMLVPQVVGFKLTRRAAGGRDRHRPRPDRDPDPAPDRRRREVRRVLRPRSRRAPARRPRDDREHVARVRRDVRLLPRRRADARLPAPDRPPRRAHRPRRGLLQGEPALAPTRRRADVLAGRRARPLDRRAEARRPAPPAGPRAARAGEDGVPRRRSGRSASSSLTNGSHDKAVADTFPASDPTTEQAPGGAPSPSPTASPVAVAAPGAGRACRWRARTTSSSTAAS